MEIIKLLISGGECKYQSRNKHSPRKEVVFEENIDMENLLLDANSR
jgi:hypothetical protein